MSLNVAFLWHMHQPYYADPVRGVAMMPWVRLHATKGYLDMIWLVNQASEFRCTFNITPVLIRQIQQLAAGAVRDLWHELATTPAEALSEPQRIELLEHYFKANWQNMVKPHSRFWWLLQKRGLQTPRSALARIARQFSVQELRDLQVWYHLCWFGYAANVLYDDIAELKRKGRDFSEDDKLVVWKRQQETLRTVLSFYRKASERGQIELSTTPFYHPIMPLVYNTEFARRCMPGRTLPPQFSSPEDVRFHLETARALHIETFGNPPKGLWPSEGSVCPELVPLMAEMGFDWFATDEEILWRSLRTTEKGASDRNELFRGYRVEFDGHHVDAAFRDRNLSDFIGFNATHNPPDKAAAFIIENLENIERHATHTDAICAIILDGENAWENFADGGQMFLRALYEGLARHPKLHPCTFSGHFSRHKPTESLVTLYTGSWINADFDIWIGEPEENDAWRFLGNTRAWLETRRERNEITPSQFAKAMDELAAAEGSDWFWWYGGDFTTSNDLLFDELFRRHLQNVYLLSGAAPLEALFNPICRPETPLSGIVEPADLITPVIDGRKTSYYEWDGAAIYRSSDSLTTMYRGELVLEQILFGFDMENLYLRCDPSSRMILPPNMAWTIEFKNSAIHRLSMSVKQYKLEGWRMSAGEDGESNGSVHGPSNSGGIEIAMDQILEIRVPFKTIGIGLGKAIEFQILVLESGTERERHPTYGSFRVIAPDAVYAAMHWTV